MDKYYDAMNCGDIDIAVTNHQYYLAVLSKLIDPLCLLIVLLIASATIIYCVHYAYASDSKDRALDREKEIAIEKIRMSYLPDSDDKEQS